jgi:hypothetical protein
LRGFPFKRANATEPERTLNLAILATESGGEATSASFCATRSRVFLDRRAGVDLRARVGVPREYGRLRERQTVLECEPDERMPQIVEADALAMIVQPGLSAASCTARNTFRADCGRPVALVKRSASDERARCFRCGVPAAWE